MSSAVAERSLRPSPNSPISKPRAVYTIDQILGTHHHHHHHHRRHNNNNNIGMNSFYFSSSFIALSARGVVYFFFAKEFKFIDWKIKTSIKTSDKALSGS